MYKALIISFFSAVAFTVSVTASAESSIQGDIKGVDGRRLQGAEVRIERIDKKSPAITITTNAKGFYSSSGLASVGTYKISVVEGGAVKSSVNVKTAGDKARVDFDLKPSAGKKIKHFVWVSGGTGSNLQGRWVEADENGAPIAGGLNIERKSGELTRETMRRQTNTHF